MLRKFRFTASLFRSMSSRVFLDASPPSYQGPKDRLDKSAFHKTLTVLSARVPPNKTGQLLKACELKGCVLSTGIMLHLLIYLQSPYGLTQDTERRFRSGEPQRVSLGATTDGEILWASKF